ncbi:MAG: hypothetical protein QG588_1450 [Candidatus Poribacteria bacterium]|nr:hypothetical protein [Candidatus Poribacteria bacterium]
MSTSIQVMELFNIFSETWGKEKAQAAIKDIEELIDFKKQELATKADVLEVKRDLKEVELKLTKEIEQAKSSTIKWVIGWVAGFIIAQTAVILTMFTLLK